MTVVTRDEDASAPVAESGPCVGNAPPTLLHAIQERAAETRLCYERALLRNPALAGRMRIMIRIGEDGGVQNAELDHDALDDADMQRCVLATFQGAFTPAPENGCVQVHIPLVFKAKTKADASVP